MKIGILVSYIGNFGVKGLYNSQEVGMAKELNENGNEVVIYKFISNKNNRNGLVEVIKKGITINYIPVKSLGTHGLSKLNELDSNLDILIHFSDIQFIFIKVYKWCKINNVKLIPYVGVIKSNNNSKIIRKICKMISNRNIRSYKMCPVLAKTPYIKVQLLQSGVKRVHMLPVGLDVDLLKKDYLLSDREILREKYDLENTDIVLLFIGRLDGEKRPVEAIEILNSLNLVNKKYKMILLGKGKMKKDVFSKMEEYKLHNRVIYIESLPNNEVWELYHLSDYFINLNTNEIFGMAILEAMYYRCCVIARSAPGPNYIIDKSKYGYLAHDNEEIKEIILNSESEKVEIEERAVKRIEKNFRWRAINITIEKIYNEISRA